MLGRMETNRPTPTESQPSNLWSEVAAAREVMDGLLQLWRAQDELTIDDARRLSVLVFNGARAVASLLYHQARLSKLSPENDWMDAVLAQLGEEMDAEL